MTEKSAGAAAAAAVAWHSLEPEAALQRQGVTVAAGLTTAEADARRARVGPNKFAEAATEPRWQAFVRQYKDPMQIVLLVAGVVSLFLPDQVATGVVLIGLTLLNAAMGLQQEGKASASVAALQKMMIVKAKTRRDGALVELPMEELVPGDIVNIEAGDLVPADGRIITAATLEVDESALTGESVPVPKQVDAVAADAGLGDRVDLVFMNTQVTRGAGEIVVTATGMLMQVGHISGMLQSEGIEKTPLTKELDSLTNQILIIAAVALLASTLRTQPRCSLGDAVRQRHRLRRRRDPHGSPDGCDLPPRGRSDRPRGSGAIMKLLCRSRRSARPPPPTRTRPGR